MRCQMHDRCEYVSHSRHILPSICKSALLRKLDISEGSIGSKGCRQKTLSVVAVSAGLLRAILALAQRDSDSTHTTHVRKGGWAGNKLIATAATGMCANSSNVMAPGTVCPIATHSTKLIMLLRFSKQYITPLIRQPLPIAASSHYSRAVLADCVMMSLSLAIASLAKQSGTAARVFTMASSPRVPP